ncbi:MAG: hypothetical protein SFY95_00190 [Planctomycetota bacterium]|nr:hypothetical protein [Planctomycetota bacterium]
MSSARRHSPGAFWGSLIGFNGWALGVAVVALATGTFGQLWDLVLGGLAISSGLGLLVLAGDDRERGPVASALEAMDLCGRLLISIAVLALLVTHWVTPRIERIPEFMKLVQGPIRVPDLISISLALAGAVVLAFERRSIGRTREKQV